MEEIVARKRPSLLLTLEVSDLAMATKNWDLDGNARDIRLPINKGGKLRWFSRKLGICKVRLTRSDEPKGIFFNPFGTTVNHWNQCSWQNVYGNNMTPYHLGKNNVVKL